MAYNGAGTFVRLYSWVADKASAIKINASRMDAEMDGFATGLSNCITKDGQTTLTADIPFNSRKLTGLGNATAGTDALNRDTADARYAPLASGSLSGFRNRLINGNFAVNQRAVSGTVTLAAGAYGHDRWKAGASGCTYTFATSGNDTTITITSGSLVQVVEGLNIEGGVYALSWTGTATGRVAISGGTTTGAYAASPITTGSATGAQIITVEFTLGTLGKVQLETGAANTFERRPYGLELALCQRYYEVVPVHIVGYGVTSVSLGSAVPFKVSKRTSSPAASWGAEIYNSNAQLRTLDTISAEGFRAYVNAVATGGVIYGASVIASNEL